MGLRSGQVRAQDQAPIDADLQKNAVPCQQSTGDWRGKGEGRPDVITLAMHQSGLGDLATEAQDAGNTQLEMPGMTRMSAGTTAAQSLVAPTDAG